jgi:hypothetical protein
VKRALVVLVLAACGPESGAWVTIEAPLRVPDQCDSVRVSATLGGKNIFDSARVIPAGQQFPQTLALYSAQAADEGKAITVEVTALLGGNEAAAWSKASANVTLEHGKLVPVTVRLVEP